MGQSKWARLVAMKDVPIKLKMEEYVSNTVQSGRLAIMKDVQTMLSKGEYA